MYQRLTFRAKIQTWQFFVLLEFDKFFFFYSYVKSMNIHFESAFLYVLDIVTHIQRERKNPVHFFCVSYGKQDVVQNAL